MTSRVPLIINAGSGQIQELATGEDLSLSGSNIATVINVTASGALSTTGNVVGGNLRTGGLISSTGNVTTQGIVSASGNIVTAGYFVGNFAGNITGNLVVPGSNTQILFNTSGNADAVAGLTYNKDSNVLTILGNVSAGNVGTTLDISATGNVTGAYILGNGSQLTGVSALVSSIQNGLSDITISNLDGNANVSIGGISNVVIFTNAGFAVTGAVSATGNVTGAYILGNGSQLTGVSATSVGTLPSLSVTGNVTGGNVLTGGLISSTGNVTGGNVLTGGNVSAINYTGTTVSVSGNVTGGNLSSGGVITITGNVTGGNILTAGIVSATGNVSGNYFIGDGSQLTGIAASYGNANVVANLAALGSNPVSSTGNVTAGNILTAGIVSATGNVSGNYFIGNGSALTGISTVTPAKIANGTSQVNISASNGNANISINGTSNVIVVSTTGAYVTGIVSATGNVNAGNIASDGQISVTGNVTGGNINSGGLISTNANVSGGNILTGGIISATSNVTGGNILTGGIISSTGNITGGIISSTGNVTGGNILTGGIISATSNVTGGNILTGGIISSTGNAIHGNLSVNAGEVTLGSIVNANGNGIGNIGSDSGSFNTIFAKATSAQYADLAEVYVSDAKYEPGTVLSFGGTQEVTLSTTDLDPTVAGVVSAQPSYIMNAGQQGEHVTMVALTGRVPVKVVGLVTKGAMMVSAGNGRARAEANPAMGTVIGKALKAFNGSEGVIEVVVGRL